MVELSAIETTSTGLRFSGELDICTALSLEQAVDAVLATWPSPRLELDMGDCTFVDSGGLYGLIRTGLIARKHGITATLTNPNPALLRLLHISGLNGDAPFDIDHA